jgi:predicted transcriptional regulator
MLDTPNMPAKAVQISLDSDLLREVDADPETRKQGRSAFMRSAILNYLGARRRSLVDQAIRKAYGGNSRAMAEDVDDLIEAQAWPRS